MLGHLAHHEARFLEGVGAMQHLSRAEGAGLGTIGLDVGYGAGLPAPGMVYEQLGIHPEQVVEQVFVLAGVTCAERATRDVSHRAQTRLVELAGRRAAHTPEVGKGTMVPEQVPVAHLVELGDARPVLVGRHVLRDDVHRHLCEVEVGAQPDGCRDSRLREHVAGEHRGEFVRRHACRAQVSRHVDEDLVDGIDVDVLRCDVAQVYLVDLGAALEVEGHPWRGDDVVEGEAGVLPQLIIVAR